jgi:hypothetical protein
VKTQDSSRGYGVRLENPKGGYMWIGVAFRDRNDAFDFGVAFQDSLERRKKYVLSYLVKLILQPCKHSIQKTQIIQ